MKTAALFLLPLIALLAQAVYRVGDRVEAYDAGWNKGAVVEVGSGNYQGYYLVKYDAFSTQRWFKPDSLRAGGAPDAPKTYPAYRVGDAVEGYDFGWYSGRVTETRQGKDSTEYLIKYDKFTTSRWYHPRDMRSAAVAASTAASEQQAKSQAATQGPRLGKYGVYSYGATSAPPLYLGHVELMAGEKYRVSRTSGPPYFGEGTYHYNAAASTVEWTSGPYAAPEWGGKFSTDGARHRIALRSRTVASNSGPE